KKEEEAGMHWVALSFWFAICFAVAGIGSWWTAGEINDWYRGLTKPAIAPPNWVFGPVWTVLYALMAISAWLVSQSAPSSWRTCALTLFFAQLGLNLAWSWIFFRRHAIGAALAEVILLWAGIGVTLLVFSRVEPLAAWLLAPYWAWVSFAAVLNAALWRINKPRAGSIWFSSRQRQE
ncbi:MAG: tryptophan-rich sensory protein, partial [Acidobacteriaceae bacterium]|nr:tryptophan-rich sensory protein [Acidobacteriaceae bacterium]